MAGCKAVNKILLVSHPFLKKTQELASTLFLIIVLFLTSCWAISQAVSFAWLSSFPVQASRLQLLEMKFWSYTGLSIVLFVIDIIYIKRVLKRYNRDHKVD
jgi:membrane protein implicated in regulation of membrane protease activity